MNIFTNVAGRKSRRSKFNLSHEKKMSLNMAELIPIMNEEIVPGDRFKVNSEILLRFAPMIAPMMHRVNVYTHYFFVPNRLLWKDWESFITGGRDGTETPAHPQLRIRTASQEHYKKGKLSDYMGIPPCPATVATEAEINISALPFRAYQQIYQEYYQDQNLNSELDIDLGGGIITDVAENSKLLTLRNRSWEKDYFTSALPWAQRGGSSSVPGQPNYLDEAQITDGSGNPYIPSAGAGNLFARDTTGKLAAVSATGDPRGIENLESVDVEINDLRKAVRLQEWLERTARGGSRYIEQILSHFGVKSSDARLQRPEYLGGGKSPVVISEVLNTAGDTGSTDPLPQGNMSGHGISVGRTNGFSRSFEEHGQLIGIMSIIPKTCYQDGIEKQFLRADKFDYYWPEFAQLGEQEVQNRELYADYTTASGNKNNDTFGYQSRYSEYKYKNSQVAGDFRDTLNFWHLGRQFSGLPVLNNSFVESKPDSRIFAVTDPDEDKLYCQVYNSVSAIRPMPYFNNPTL